MSNNNFRYQPFVAVSGNLVGKVPIVDDVLSSHEQEIYPTTSLDENCIEFDFQTDRNYYVDLRQSFLALEATHRRSITLLQKHRIHSLKNLYPQPAQRVRNFGR